MLDIAKIVKHGRTFPAIALRWCTYDKTLGRVGFVNINYINLLYL